ncbi:hypothetical protein Csa_004920 [Cucumis sativus]|uniref:Uncharacterized protein n=1 Tax=Cucumis sativus TaxID=3659 RepID=A0A0A0KCK8_CUCSA|nr:hypothetical protein Csa_004920 [Cucumis sativus]
MKIRWLPPATGEIKLNVDASIHSSERFGKVFEGWLRVVGRCQLQLLKFKIWLQNFIFIRIRENVKPAYVWIMKDYLVEISRNLEL